MTEFERTSSVNFQRAVELAQFHPNFIALMDERNVLVYRNIYRQDALAQFQEMYKLIKHWKGAKLYLSGERVDFDMLGGGIRCYLQKEQIACEQFSEADVSHRSNTGYLGCRRSHISMAWHPSQPFDRFGWFMFGALDSYRMYHIKKEELEGAVISDLIEYRACPLLEFDTIHQIIRQLPERIDPRKDQEWKYAKKPGERVFPGEPAILPISEAAYCEYLSRKLGNYRNDI